MALKILTEVRNIMSVGEAMDTLSRLVDYIKFRPTVSSKPKVTYDSMAVRDLAINTGGIKMIKFFQKVQKTDPSVTMYLQLLKKYFLDAYDWSDLEQEGYEEFEADALWLCDEIEDYLHHMNVHADLKHHEDFVPPGDIILRKRLHAE